MAELTAAELAYQNKHLKTQEARLKWWQEARFGMFVHWGLYSQLQRHEWVMNYERIPVAEYDKLADTWKPRPGAPRQWARLARDAGMKYMVLTTKHHEGFLLWDSKMSDFNAVQRGPGRDLVAEYVAAAREFGLKVGFYYSLMDWRHPDGARCASDEDARRRFCDYTYGCVRELMANYGKIDILWYDVSWPLATSQAWESAKLNAMARKLQPHILINNRSQLDEDFGTPEEHIKAERPGRAWEACMTFNGSWGYQPAPPEDWHSVRAILNMLRTCAAGGGNLLLNIGPKADGSVPAEATERLTATGRWLKRYGEAIYGRVDRVEGLGALPTGAWSRKKDTYYYWCTRWPGSELHVGGLTTRLSRARLYGTKKDLPFEQTGNRLVIRGLPPECPDKIAHVAMIEMKFRATPWQDLSLGGGASSMLDQLAAFGTKWHSPHVDRWQVSKLLPLKGDDVAAAGPVKLSQPVDWQTVHAQSYPAGFVNIHERAGEGDGVIYLANRFRVARGGTWIVQLGHDGGAKLFVNGKAVFAQPQRRNP